MSKPFPDVVVFLPGIMGSVLAKDGKEVWAPSCGAISRGVLTLGKSIRSLAIGNDDPSIDDPGDGVVATRLFPTLHLIPGFWKIDGYSTAVEYIRRTFHLQPGRNLFEFPYDWRRDNRVSACRLTRECYQWLKTWKGQSGNTKAKLILIGHSMGGLVARYFAEAMEGWHDTRMLITLGTPHRGSINALGFIVNGLKKKIGPLTLLDLSDLTRSFCSVYQLLPQYPCVDNGNGHYLRVNELTSVTSLDQKCVARALSFHEEIQRAVKSHQSEQNYSDYTLHPVVGTYQQTMQSAIIEGSGVQLLPEYKGEDLSGDGTVPRVAAVPQGKGAQFAGVSVAQRHSSLQSTKTVHNQIEYLLSGININDVVFKALDQPVRVGLALEDLYSSAEPITVDVRCNDASLPLDMEVASIETGSTVLTAKAVPQANEEWARVQLHSLTAGSYRISVGRAGAQKAQDVFWVLDA